MSLYNNKNQEEVFHLHSPQSTGMCSTLKAYFPNFLNCENSYVLAEPTSEFNCIGWAIGVKEFIDPTIRINKFYNEKVYAGGMSIEYVNGDKSTITFSNYKKDTSACLKATKSFFDEFNNKSVLPQKDNYIAVEKISYPPSDDTIAFYFKEGKDFFDEEKNAVSYKGFQHAARYVKDVNDWVSEIWTSKLGPNVLITHKEHELDGDTYGNILCYLVAEDRNTWTPASGESVKEEL